MSPSSSPAPAAVAAVVRPTPRSLALVVGLGVANALWALFQWTQLVAARTGGSSFCGLNDEGSCAGVWDSAFATAVHEATGIPVAGWGLVWSLPAILLPLWTLVLRANAEDREAAHEPVNAWLGTLWLSIGGLVAVVVLIAASLVHGALCSTCALTYTLVTAYAATCFVQTPPWRLPLTRGISPAALTLAVSCALLFVPGLQTPMNEAAEGRKALLKVAGEEAATLGRDDEAAPAEETGPLARVGELLAELPPQLQQLFADELLRYAHASPPPIRPPRSLIGSADAPVRLTEFTDALCSHCATLHETLGQLRAALPADAFSIEARHFPLDAACNPEIQAESTQPVRCLAARAAICMEGRPEAFEFSGLVYGHQRALDDEQIFRLAGGWISREELESCASSPATDTKLQDDIAWAIQHEIAGTPLVLLNGRPVAPFGPLLYALILTGGDASHPVFDGLPRGVLRDPHEDHAH